eukprot:251777-Hanusia_phi.AAC.1
MLTSVQIFPECPTCTLSVPHSPSTTASAEPLDELELHRTSSHHPSIPSLQEAYNNVVATPSPAIRTLKPGNLSNLRVELFHFFLSYRVSTESWLIGELYDTIIQTCVQERKIPHGGKGRWPKFAQVPEYQNSVKGFLDTKCLMEGKDWEAGFVLGLVHSLVFVPLISWHEEPAGEPSSQIVCRGSLGDMVSLCKNDRVDNILLEYIIALEWSRKERTYLQSIVPILIGKKEDDGTFSSFPWSKLHKLPDIPSRMTNDRAAIILEMLGINQDQIEKMRRRSVKQTIELILKHQGIRLSDVGKNDRASEFCARKVIDIIVRDIQKVQVDPNEFVFQTPGGSEIVQWLRERSLVKLSSSFARHNFDSLHKISMLADKDFEDIFDTRSTNALSITRGQLASLRIALEDLRSQGICQKYSRRLNDFRDLKTALGTAVWTTNAAEIACSKWQVQFIFIVLSGVCTKTAVDNLNGKLRYWRTRNFGVILWVKIVWYIPFWISNAIIFLKAAYEGRYKAPYKARKTMEAHNLRWNYLLLLGILAEVSQILTNNHERHWTLADTFSSGGLAFELLLYLPACLLTWSAIKYRQEYWIPCWIGLAIVVTSVFVYIWKDFRTYLLMLILLLTFFALSLFYFAISLILTTLHAKKTVGRHVPQFNTEWEKILSSTIPSIDNLRETSTSKIENGNAIFLQKLWENTQTIEKLLESQFRSTRADVPIWKRIHQDSNKGYGRFTRQDKGASMGKIRQLSSDLDHLFEEASSINSVFHDFIAELLKPLQSWSEYQPRSDQSVGELRAHRYPHLVCGPIKQPERAIEKCVRTYRRDVGCLTDLVRCTIVVENAQQLLEVFETFRTRSIIGIGAAERNGEAEPINCRSEVSAETEALLRAEEGRASSFEEPFFRITQVKNRFHSDSHHCNKLTGYRDLSLNVEVGWTFESNELIFLPVREWNQETTEQHIVEVQEQQGNTPACVLQVITMLSSYKGLSGTSRGWRKESRNAVWPQTDRRSREEKRKEGREGLERSRMRR